MNKLVMKKRNNYISGNTVLAPGKKIEEPLVKAEYLKLRKSQIDRENRIIRKKNEAKKSILLRL